MIKRNPLAMGIVSNNEDVFAHEGIRTVGVENSCDFSSTSDLCISIITWNMNGRVPIYI